MRFLKNKILRASEALKRNPSAEASPPPLLLSPASETSSSLSNSFDLERNHNPVRLTNLNPPNPKGKPITTATTAKKPRKPSSTKNLVINYGKAIASFAVSYLALPYLNPLLKNEGITLQEFTQFISRSKGKIGGIKSFRYLILTTPGDSERSVACKRVFREISIIFIKYFSVNWIMHGKLTHKMTYLQYRFKMLRRVQDPENFIYVKQRIYKKKE